LILEGAEASSAVGLARVVEEMMMLETDPGGGSRSTSLTTRECYILVVRKYFYILDAQHVEEIEHISLLSDFIK
jgi:hypothetical protein